MIGVAISRILGESSYDMVKQEYWRAHELAIKSEVDGT